MFTRYPSSKWIILSESAGQKRFLKAVKAAIVAFPLFLVCVAVAADPPDSKESLLQTARQVIDNDEATLPDLQRAAYLLESNQNRFPDEIRIPIYLAKAYYRMADPDKDIDREFVYYDKVATYAQEAIKMAPSRAEGHYWYGLFLLKKAQKVGGLHAFFIVGDGIRELKLVRENMPKYDHAGASRVLGLLSCRAPSWTPFGNLDRCIQLAEESVRIAPDHPQNRLYLANAYKKQGDTQAAIREYRALLSAASILPREEAQQYSQEAIDKLESLGQSVEENYGTLQY